MATTGLSEAANGLRGRIVADLRQTWSLRAAIVRRGSIDEYADLERCFTPYAEAGDFNRLHPEHRIGDLDLVDCP